MIELACWNTPTARELKMDAEIGAYQEDGEPRPDPPQAAGRSPARHPDGEGQ
jgi:hypothetical protein